MRLSIRYQIVALVGGLLLSAMSVNLWLATSLFTSDKLAYLYDFNSRLVGTLSEEVHANLSSLVDKLLFFGAEQAAHRGQVDPDQPAHLLFTDDTDMLSLEVWERSAAGFTRSYRHVNGERLAAFNLSEEELDQASQEHPLSVAGVVAEKVVLQNVSLAPDVGLLRLAAVSRDGRRLVVADLRPDRLLRIFARPELSDVSLVDGRGITLVHPDPVRVLSHADVSETPLARLALEGKVARGVRELETPAGAMIGAFAMVGLGRLAVLIELPKAEALRASQELVRRSVLLAVLVMMVTLLASIFFSRHLTAPLRRLEETMAIISAGNFGVEVPLTSRNEIGRLAAAFNRMSRELSQREALLMEANAQLIQSEKLSALGVMSAGIVHEVKNPMVGIMGFAELGEVADDLKEAQEFFGLIRSDAQRANEILQRLLEFARPEQVEHVRLDPNEVVRGAIRLVAHQLQMNRVKLTVSYAEGLPQVNGNANQLRQVLVNLMMNAAHAMEASREKSLHVSTSSSPSGGVVVAVRDTGTGMSEETKKRLFRPFFTTKPRGKGTGLGLSVSRGIIQQHQGELTVESEPGQGSTFHIHLRAAISLGLSRPHDGAQKPD